MGAPSRTASGQRQAEVRWGFRTLGPICRIQGTSHIPVAYIARAILYMSITLGLFRANPQGLWGR